MAELFPLLLFLPMGDTPWIALAFRGTILGLSPANTSAMCEWYHGLMNV